MCVDEHAKYLVDAACTGQVLDCEQLAYLLSFACDSETADYVRTQADQLSRKACKGRGFIHAQIGLDRLPCPENCRFCLFAVCNQDAAANAGAVDVGAATAGTATAGVATAGVANGENRRMDGKSSYLVDLADVEHAASIFSQGGAHLISLMATASYPFALLEEAVRRVRAVAPQVAVMVNCADMDAQQALRLKDAGATVAYHALRLREGRITDISPETRKATVAAIHQAGLQLMTGVEPVFEEATDQELAQLMCQVRDFAPYCTGVCKLTKSEGADCELTPVSRDRLRYIACVLRLAVGAAVPLGCAGAAIWVDAGTDPRGRGYAADDDTLRMKLKQARESLVAAGWEVPAAASAEYWRG